MGFGAIMESRAGMRSAYLGANGKAKATSFLKTVAQAILENTSGVIPVAAAAATTAVGMPGLAAPAAVAAAAVTEAAAGALKNL